MHEWSYSLAVCKVTRGSVLQQVLAHFKVKAIDSQDEGWDSVGTGSGEVVRGGFRYAVKSWIIRDWKITQKVVLCSFFNQKTQPLSAKGNFAIIHKHKVKEKSFYTNKLSDSKHIVIIAIITYTVCISYNMYYTELMDCIVIHST